MLKLKCNCHGCKTRIDEEFDLIVNNPKNGVWIIDADYLKPC